jgi:AcrR family transcriptional regulator
MADRRDAGEDTRRELLLAAERLFAERGIDAVSLREINLTAGQRNKSAVHYHFGGKRALIEALFALRMREVDRRRHARLDALDLERADLQTLVAAVVYPLAEQIDGSPRGGHYLRFLAQVHHAPEGWEFDAIRRNYDGGLRRAFAEIQRRLAHLPGPILLQRGRDAIAFTVRALGDRERGISRPAGSRRELSLPLFVANLVDTIVGVLEAPVSAATRAELESKDRRRA